LLLLLCIGSAVITCLAPCVTLGQIAEIVDEGATRNSLIHTNTYILQKNRKKKKRRFSFV